MSTLNNVDSVTGANQGSAFKPSVARDEPVTTKGVCSHLILIYTHELH